MVLVLLVVHANYVVDVNKLSNWFKMYTSRGGWEEKWRLKLISAKVEVKVEAEPISFSIPILLSCYAMGE